MGIDSQIARNVGEVRRRIEAAARRAGRRAEDILLVAVTKYRPPGDPLHRSLAAAGCRILGESRPQQLYDKASTWDGPPVQWHLIGPLQRNKIRRILPYTAMIHSVDSLRLADTVDRIAGESGLRPAVLLEVNISGESAKIGFRPQELEGALRHAADLPHVDIVGLMGMAGLASSLADTRRQFTKLRDLRDRLRMDCPEHVQLDHLSMGMSGDYEIAIEEGATIVRIGSALYEGL